MCEQCWQSVVEPTLFFLVGVMDQVYRTPVRHLTDLQKIIYPAVNSVTQKMLQVEAEYRFGHFPPMEAMLRFMEHEVKRKVCA